MQPANTKRTLGEGFSFVGFRGGIEGFGRSQDEYRFADRGGGVFQSLDRFGPTGLGVFIGPFDAGSSGSKREGEPTAFDLRLATGSEFGFKLRFQFVLTCANGGHLPL